VVFNYPINDGSSPHTVVRVWMRGAPDNGKNSYATLIEPFCADNQGKRFCDEIDIVEYYGQTSHQRSEFTVYQNGKGPVGFFVWPTPTPSTSPPCWPRRIPAFAPWQSISGKVSRRLRR
jgi:hypothetical protein